MEDFTICLNCMKANSLDATDCAECQEPIEYVPITMNPRQLGQAFRRWVEKFPDEKTPEARKAINLLKAQEKWRRQPANPEAKLYIDYPICLNCQRPVDNMAYCTCGARIKP